MNAIEYSNAYEAGRRILRKAKAVIVSNHNGARVSKTIWRSADRLWFERIVNTISDGDGESFDYLLVLVDAASVDLFMRD